MQTEDDDIPINNSPPDSQTSSIEGVYPAPSKTSHPFRIIEHDTLSLQSMTSLGRVGRILAGVNDNATLTAPVNLPQGTVAQVAYETHVSQNIAINIPNKDEDSESGKVSRSSSSLTLSGDNLNDIESCIDDRQDQGNMPVMLQEPDVIASTKNNVKPIENAQDFTLPSMPVAPPRRKKKSKPQTPTDLTVRHRDSNLLLSTPRLRSI